MKKKQRILKVLSFGGYPFDVVLAIGVSDADVLRYLRRHLGRDLTPEEVETASIENVSCLGRTSRLLGGQLVLRLRYLNPSPESMATLAHEIYHAVFLMMSHIGVTPSDDSDEAYAYAIQDLTAQALAVVNR